jgi:hypothetical protein
MIFERGHFRDNTISKSLENELLNESRTFSESLRFVSKPTIFLSHKHYDEKDKEHEDLRGIIKLLEDSGGKVYIDSFDNQMPNTISGETAQRIKNVIKSCDKFILFATNEAIESFWCNWELGIGDTYKYMEHIAILPMKDDGASDTKYKGNEYLQIYPRIDYEYGTRRYKTSREIVSEGYYFSKPENKEGVRIITPLTTWLNKK